MALGSIYESAAAASQTIISHTNSAKTTISRIDFAELAEISLLAGAWFSVSKEGRSEYIMVG
jgi:hypothetical protein